MALNIDPLLFNIGVILAALYIIFKAADLLVFGISDYAKKLGLSESLIGLVVVAMAASMPEIIASLTGLIIGDNGILFGTILGTNMVHAALVIGVLVLIGKELKIEDTILLKYRKHIWVLIFAPFILMFWDGVLGRIDGVILITLFTIYIVKLWQLEGKASHLKKQVPFKTIWKDMFIFVGCLAAILMSGRWLVFSAVNISNLMGIPSFFIALTVISIGGAMPDFAIGLKSILKGHSQISIGEILGSVILEFLLFFGIIALFNPITIDRQGLLGVSLFILVGLSLLLHFIKDKKLTRKHGLIFIALYTIFIISEVLKIV